MIAASLSEATTGSPVGSTVSATATPVVPVIGGVGGPVPGFGSLEVLVNELLELVVDDQHKGTAGATQYVRPCALEEGLASLLPVDLAPRVDCAVVVLLATRLCSSTDMHSSEIAQEITEQNGDAGAETQHHTDI